MKKLTLFLLMLFVTSFAFSQVAQTRSPIKLDLDVARFQYDKQNIYLEFYYSLEQSELKYPRIDLTFMLYDAFNDSLLAQTPISLKFSGNGIIGQAASQMGIIKTIVQPGEYKAVLKPVGILDKNIKAPEKKFTTNIFANDRITLSDLELAYEIKQSSDKKSVFYKNTLEVIPTASGYFGRVSKNIFYYIEMYNMATVDTVSINLAIADMEGKIIAEKKYLKNGGVESLVDVGAFPIKKDIKTGYYAFVYSVGNLKENYTVYRKKLLFIDKSAPENNLAVIDEAAFKKSVYYQMSEPELDLMFKQASYIATRNEKLRYQGLTTINAKKRMLFNFWSKRNKKNPDFEKNYYSRVEIANERYSGNRADGWQTDRGRVFIVYGEPSEIERHQYESGTNPYHVWKYYDIQGGVEFDFVDWSGTGDYKLVNSTHRDELQDPNWQNYLYY